LNYFPWDHLPLLFGFLYSLLPPAQTHLRMALLHLAHCHPHAVLILIKFKIHIQYAELAGKDAY
jgi:hypothetical protein